MGIPAVGTNVVGIKDLIIPGETGYLVEEGDYKGLATAVLSLLENPSLLTLFSENAKRMTSTNFNFNEGIKEYEHFYTEQCLRPA